MFLSLQACPNDNFEDYSSGRVLYSGQGIPNFPIRLLNEMYGRAKSHLEKKEDIIVYDPCCGGGYALTILGIFDNLNIGKLYASDVNTDMVEFSKKNLGLLTYCGLMKRKQELQYLYELYGKQSHREALSSWENIYDRLKKEITADIFKADCTKTLPNIKPDIIITDVPYGNLVNWTEETGLNAMLEQLWNISHSETVLAVCMDKGQKVESSRWTRVEKHNVGKRHLEILKKNTSLQPVTVTKLL